MEDIDLKQELEMQAKMPATNNDVKLTRDMSMPDMIMAMMPEIKKALPAVITPERFTRIGVVTAMYDAGVSEKVIQSWAGHSDIATTRHYDRRSMEISLTDDELMRIFS